MHWIAERERLAITSIHAASSFTCSYHALSHDYTLKYAMQHVLLTSRPRNCMAAVMRKQVSKPALSIRIPPTKADPLQPNCAKESNAPHLPLLFCIMTIQHFLQTLHNQGKYKFLVAAFISNLNQVKFQAIKPPTTKTVNKHESSQTNNSRISS